MAIAQSMPIIYGFAFQRFNVSCRTLYALPNINHRTLLWGKQSIDRYLSILLKAQPAYILGLGIFHSRKNERPPIVHIEQSCYNNYFNKAPIDLSNHTVLNMPGFLKEGFGSALTQTIGNSYCNYISWQITSLINEGKLHARFTFLHLLKQDESTTTTTVKALVDSFRTSLLSDTPTITEPLVL